jgi:GIY-YIG catalytic domain
MTDQAACRRGPAAPPSAAVDPGGGPGPPEPSPRHGRHLRLVLPPAAQPRGLQRLCRGRRPAAAVCGDLPHATPANGTAASRQQLRSRLQQHYRGNAAGSTLRLTLGCILATQLGLQLRRVGSGQRLTFADGEQALSAWMASHARVCWMTHPRPWELEQALVARLDLPLNLHGNAHHPFYQPARCAGRRQGDRPSAPSLVNAAATATPCVSTAGRDVALPETMRCPPGRGQAR